MNNTMILSIWHEQGRTAIYGSIKRIDGTIEAGVIESTGEYIWKTLDNALDAAKAIKMQNLLMLCNDPDVVHLGASPIPPDQTEKIWVFHGKGKGAYKDIPFGGCRHMWNILYHTTAYKRWKMKESQNLPKARELYEASFTERA